MSALFSKLDKIYIYKMHYLEIKRRWIMRIKANANFEIDVQSLLIEWHFIYGNGIITWAAFERRGDPYYK